MRRLQTTESKQAFLLLRKMTLSKQMNQSVKRAIRVRLEIILEAEERSFQSWEENIREKLNRTRAKQIERNYHKKIQALKIVISMLTPYDERTEDVPTFVIRKPKK